MIIHTHTHTQYAFKNALITPSVKPYLITKKTSNNFSNYTFNYYLFQMSSAMDALKYSNYMSQGMGLYGFTGQDTSPTQSSAATTMSSDATSPQTKLGYSAEALSRSYLEQQKSYYESAACLKGYGGGGGSLERPSSQSAYDAKSFTPESMTDRQSTESPDIKKPLGGVNNGLDTSSPSALQQQQQQVALQAYYNGGGGGMPTTSQAASLPPLLPMAAQLSQYSTGTMGGAAGYSQPGAPTGTDYSRRPLSVLF